MILQLGQSIDERRFGEASVALAVHGNIGWREDQVDLQSSPKVPTGSGCHSVSVGSGSGRHSSFSGISTEDSLWNCEDASEIYGIGCRTQASRFCRRFADKASREKSQLNRFKPFCLWPVRLQKQVAKIPVLLPICDQYLTELPPLQGQSKG